VDLRYCAISSRAVCPEPVPNRIRRLLDAGVPLVQLRDKTLPDRLRYNWVMDLNQSHRERLIINSRPDLASITGCMGSHLPANSYSLADARSLLDESALVGRSTHSREEAKRANNMGADYIMFGPVYPTPSKPDRNQAEIPGPQGLQEVCESVSIPVLALGGINRPDHIQASFEAGASGVAGIRMLFASDSPESDWEKARKAIDSVQSGKEPGA